MLLAKAGVKEKATAVKGITATFPRESDDNMNLKEAKTLVKKEK